MADVRKLKPFILKWESFPKQRMSGTANAVEKVIGRNTAKVYHKVVRVTER